MLGRARPKEVRLLKFRLGMTTELFDGSRHTRGNLCDDVPDFKVTDPIIEVYSAKVNNRSAAGRISFRLAQTPELPGIQYLS